MSRAHQGGVLELTKTLKNTIFKVKCLFQRSTLKDRLDAFYELSEQQKRQLIDAEMLFSALKEGAAEAIRHRGSMFWPLRALR